MRKALIGCLCLVFSLIALGHVSDEQLAVAEYLIRRIALAPENLALRA